MAAALQTGSGANPQVDRDQELMPAIAVDTREQRPYHFENAVRKRLASGDYSLVGFEERVAIERKSLGDAYGSLGGGRERFRREVERLAKLDYAAIVVEATFEEFLKGPQNGTAPRKMHPHAAVHSLLSWGIEFPSVHVHFAGDRRLGRGLVYHLLRHFWRKHGGSQESAPFKPKVVTSAQWVEGAP